MKCPSCEMVTSDSTYCNNCSTDLILYDKVHMMAVRLYNKGLGQAQGRCLSGAIETLLMCIRLQKHHIDARNLLGLVYWEVGEIGQAIKHWVVSLSYKKEENIANQYLEKIQSQPSQLAKYSDTMILFNKSLQYIAQGSEDIAIISLRKAISQNPNYIEAKSLLSLYYITRQQEDKAKELLEEILMVNKDHPEANRYWNSLNPNLKLQKEEPQRNIKRQQTQIQPRQPAVPKMANNMIQPKSLEGTIIAFILGAVCMLGVYMILIGPSKTATLEEQIKIAKENEIKLQDKLQIIVEEKEQDLEKLKTEKENLEKANEALQEKQTIQDQVLEFQDAKSLSQNREWVEAANKLYSINGEYLQGDIKTQYDNLVKEVYPKAGDELYRLGYTQYQRKAYAEAQELLEKSYLYAKEEYFSDNALFIIGRCYEDQDNMEQAKQYYQSVVDNYPGTDSAYNAQRRLGQ